MIKVTAGNNVKRETVIIDEHTTIRNCLEDLDIKYNSGVMNLDGTPLSERELDSTFEQLGVASDSTCYLLNVVKADNA